MNGRALLQFGLFPLVLTIASGCLWWQPGEPAEFDRQRWNTWPSLHDPYNRDRLEMVDSIQKDLGRATEEKLLSELGPPDVASPLLGPSPCEGVPGCQVLRWHLGYEDGPVRLDPLTLFVVVQDGVVHTIATTTL